MKVIVDAVETVLGVTEATPTISIFDYSRRSTDEFGDTTVVERGFSRRMSVKFLVPSDEVDALQLQVASLRATQATWVADEDSEWLSPEGYFKDFDVDLATDTISYCTLTVEGLAETEVGADPGGDPAPDGQTSTLSIDDDGTIVLLGITEANANVGIIDYSLKEFDEFGDPQVVPRAWAKRMNVRALIRTDMIDAVANRIAAVRARPVIWKADSEYDSLQVEGFFKEFSIERGETVSRLSLTIEGLSTATDLPSFDDVFKGIQTDRYPDDAPTDPKIGSLYFDGNLRPYRFEGRKLFNGAVQLFNGEIPLLGSGWVSVRDKGLTEVVDDLQALDDDGKFTVIEKKLAIERDRQLENIYNGVIQQANALGYDATAVIEARADYITIRNSIVPAWNDTSAPSDFSNTGWDVVLDAYEAAIAKAQADMTAIAGVTVVPPPAQVILLNGDGDPDTGELPRDLLPVVKRGSVDMRTDDAVSYELTTTGDLDADINNTDGDPDKGTITLNDGTTGVLKLTVTVSGVPFGPFDIPVTADGLDLNVVITGTDGYCVKTKTRDGVILLEQWGSVEAGDNTTGTITFPVAFANTNYSITTGGAGAGGFDDKDNYPTWSRGTKTTTQVGWRNPDDTPATLDWIAKGFG